MPETVQHINIEVTARTGQATSGMDRLAEAVAKVNVNIKQNTQAQKQNSSETKKNADEHKKAGNSAKHHASGLTRLAAALKRILIYRAIRGVIKAVTGAINEGIQRMYEWSRANDQVFMRVMDTYATEVQYLKDAIGAAIAPLIEMLMPYLVQLVDWFVELINVVNQFFRALAGYDTWLKVDKVQAKFAEDTDKAAKAQKALNSQLMDFDQLNLITTPKSSGKTEEETPGLSGHYTPIDPAIAEAAAKFKKFLEPFKELKTVLADIWKDFEPIVKPFVDGVFEVAGKAILLIKDALQKLHDNGIFKIIADVVQKINEASFNLILTVLDILGIVIDKLSKSEGFKLLLEVLGKLAVGAIENTTKVLQTLADSGALDAILEGVSEIFKGLAIFLDAIADVADLLTDLLVRILPLLGKLAGTLLKSVGQQIGFIGEGLSGLIEMVAALMGMTTNADFLHGVRKVGGSIVKSIIAITQSISDAIRELKKFTNQWLQADEINYQTMKTIREGWLKEIDIAVEGVDDKTKEAAAKAGETAEKVKSSWGETFRGMSDGAEKAATTIGDTIDGILKEYKKGLSEVPTELDKIHKKMDDLSRAWARNGKYWGSEWRKGLVEELKKLNNTQITMKPGQQGTWNNTKVTVQAYAAGGYPDMGSMFIAGESGAEMVGTINGRTGVASGEEITGIAEAVYGTSAEEAALLRELIGAVRSQRLTISPSASLGKTVNQSMRLYSGVTG